MTELGTEPVKAPPLPRARTFLKETRDWYADWCRSPQASQFTPPAWRRLFMLAIVVDQFHRTGDRTLLAEIRLNEEALGATPQSMLRLRWNAKASPPAATQPAAPARRRTRRDPRLRVVK